MVVSYSPTSHQNNIYILPTPLPSPPPPLPAYSFLPPPLQSSHSSPPTSSSSRLFLPTSSSPILPSYPAIRTSQHKKLYYVDVSSPGCNHNGSHPLLVHDVDITVIRREQVYQVTEWNISTAEINSAHR